MIDIKFLRENSDIVKTNIKKKFQDHKLHLVDEIIELDKQLRQTKLKCDNLRNKRKTLSSEIGNFMKEGKKEEAQNLKLEVSKINEELTVLEKKEEEYGENTTKKMMMIPNIIHDSVPLRRR